MLLVLLDSLVHVVVGTLRKSIAIAIAFVVSCSPVLDVVHALFPLSVEWW